uniref:CX domain-containing protein n=2 Tax=Caenorhabditis tropicalis TaxID=1561998 RepID=A0A1I7TF94_9PELO
MTTFSVLQMMSFTLLISIVSCAVIHPRIQESSSTPEPWKSSQKDSSGERVRRQYPYGIGGYGNYGAYNGLYNNMYGSGYGGYSPYSYAGYTGYQYPYTNGIFPLQGGYYPGSIVGSGSIWAAGGGLVGNMLSF